MAARLLFETGYQRPGRPWPRGGLTLGHPDRLKSGMVSGGLEPAFPGVLAGALGPILTVKEPAWEWFDPGPDFRAYSSTTKGRSTGQANWTGHLLTGIVRQAGGATLFGGQKPSKGFGVPESFHNKVTTSA